MRRFFSNLASRSAYLMGHPAAFIISVLACVLWAVSGPLFDYSDTWQLVINTATTVLTFLAVFLIQNSQNRDGAAIQAKLDEILIAVGQARTELVGIENLTDSEVSELKLAIEREALEPEAQGAEGNPTVEDILQNRDTPAEKLKAAAKAVNAKSPKKSNRKQPKKRSPRA
jgi:low affinity Fe/Cu permease